MTTSVILKPDGTTEITYNDNKRIKIAPEIDILQYKCPHSSCNIVFFSQDDLNQHRILEHAEVPKNLFNLPTNNKNTKYFSRGSMQRLNASIQRENLKHIIMVLGLDLEAIRKPLIKKIKEWLDARRRNKN